MSLAPFPCTANHEQAMSEAILHVLGALALELTPGSAAARDASPQREAGDLGAAIARDLAKFSPEAAKLDLTTAGTPDSRAEERRVGNMSVRTSRTRWSPKLYKTKN